MGYLVLKDYAQYIQGDYLRQLTQGNDAKRTTEERTSLEAIAQRLTQKYDLDAEFTNTAPYNRHKNYPAAERVTIDLSSNGFVPYSADDIYEAGDLVIKDATGLYCKVKIDPPEPFDATKWAEIAPQYAIYYAAYPATCTLQGEPNPATLMSPFAPVFNYKNLYSKGDVIFWRGYTYENVIPSTETTHQAALQYAQYTNIPYGNVFPDDPVQNKNGQYWGNKTAYTVPKGKLTGLTYDAGLTYPVGDTIKAENGDILTCSTAVTVPEPFDPAKWSTIWVYGDNRSQIIKDAMVRITVFKLSPLLAPKNRPDVWLEDYRSILRELKEAAEGMITLTLPLKQPNNATRTYNGGNIKNTNNW